MERKMAIPVRGDATLLSPPQQLHVDVYGTDSVDTLYASPYCIDTTIHAGGGNDTVVGGNGNDTLLGEAGNDQLFGGAGNDTIVGGAGADVMWGGSGANTFVWNSALEATTNPNQLDTIMDFNPAEGDKIDLRGLVNEAGGINHVFIAGGSADGGLTWGFGVWSNDTHQQLAEIEVHNTTALHDLQFWNAVIVA
jgi:Ca2+-binding RTX toxin-like protein